MSENREKSIEQLADLFLTSPDGVPLHLCSPLMESDIHGLNCFHACDDNGNNAVRVYFMISEQSPKEPNQ